MLAETALQTCLPSYLKMMDPHRYLRGKSKVISSVMDVRDIEKQTGILRVPESTRRLQSEEHVLPVLKPSQTVSGLTLLLLAKD